MNLWIILLLAIDALPKSYAGISIHQQHLPVEVQTRLGKLRGSESIFLHKRVRSFLGIPFAEPPNGENRFKPPQPIAPWRGTIDATKLPSACYQGRDIFNNTPMFWGADMWNANTEINEDCLYMNIWTPAEGRNLSVMVWLFGGGFYSGSASLQLYDGKTLALLANAVIININYRLGPFGYLYFDHEDAPGNVAMLDQQVALHWIHENIDSFGGDPNRVTLFGESAGAASIIAHMIAPDSRNFFRYGILQSGSLDNKWSMDSPKRALQKSKALAKRHDCAKNTVSATIQCLREVPASILIEGMWSDLEFLEFPFSIVSRDKNFFKTYDAFIALRDGTYKKDINIIIGINHDEGNFWNIYNLDEYFNTRKQPLLNRNDFIRCVNTAFHTQPEIVRNAIMYVYSDKNCEYGNQKVKFYAEQVNQMVGDYFFTCDSIWLADQMRNASGQVYVYYFDQASSANPWPKWTGVMHGYEIEFVFGVPLHNTTAGYTLDEKMFSKKIIQLWKNFADNGIPRLDDTDWKFWPEYGKTHKWLYLRGENGIKAIERRKREECAIWREAKNLEYSKYLREVNSSPKRFNFAFVLLVILQGVKWC